MADTAPTISTDEIPRIVQENPDAVEEAFYGHLAVEAATGRPTKPAMEADIQSPPEPVVTRPAELQAEQPVEEQVEEPTESPAEPVVASPAEPIVAAAPVEPVAEPSADPDPYEGFSDVERRAVEIRKRNPDLSLEESMDRAKVQLGVAVDPEAEPEEPQEPQAPQQTPQERLAELEHLLQEAGQNEGLYTAEIAQLNIEHNRLSAQIALEEAEAKRTREAQEAQQLQAMQAQREASKQNVIALCKHSGQDAEDPNSPIGKAIRTVFEEMQAVDHPDLYDPNAPDLIFAKANLRLPEADRIEVRKISSPAVPSHPVNPPSVELPAPGTAQAVLPVPATARSAQPTSINPADLPRITKEVPVDQLEASLYGNNGGNGGGVLMRM